MYHPSRGGVRGGRDQFKWDDVKVDKHRENYLGHSIKAPVGRWQKGKDLHWYTRDKKSQMADMEAAKAEIQRIKEEEEQAMREALGLAPKRSNRPQGNRLDKHEFSELVKRGSTAEDLGAGHAEAAQVQGLGFSRAPLGSWEESSSLPPSQKEVSPEEGVNATLQKPLTQGSEDEDESRKKRKREEKRHEKHERRHDKHEKKHEKRRSRDSDDKKKHKRDKEKRRHDSD
ncbi:Kinase phosphorylation domain [Macleaya cordata]|uniref:Kinase phosphorylation domain n=1 Tax=Macleaya cordata TaxID=56857 RepID=A0A200QHV3_MACCD|nr:Kinase phosphorylation domain [Macleaya cordata]